MPPAPLPRAPLPRVALLVMAPCALLGWVFYYYLFRTTPGQDWMVFDTAAQAWFHNDLALLFDGPRFTAQLNATHSWLAEPLVFHPWVYPPYTLLLALPFGLLPWWANYTLFQGLSLALYGIALSLWAPPGRRAALILGTLACAATAFTFGSGQNSFLSAALVTMGLWFVPRRPLLGGALLGLLAFKPQLAFLVPLALVCTGAWRSIAAAALIVCLLIGTSLIVPGIAVWQAWLHLFLGGDASFHQWVNEGRLHGQSIYACAIIAGASPALATAAQYIAIAIAAACVVRAFRRPLPSRTRLAVLLTAMILAAPHVGNYDAIMLGEAAMLLLLQPPPGMPPALPVAMWCLLSFQPPSVLRLGLLLPTAAFGTLLAATRKSVPDQAA